MSQQLIGVGTTPNDKTGDPARTAFQKTNANFTELYNSAPFNVKNYGALGDGVTDDTTAIQAAITACVAAGGGVVYLPLGIYLCAGLNVTKEITISGSGLGSILALTAPLSINVGAADQAASVCLRDFACVPAAASPGNFCVDVTAGLLRADRVMVTNQGGAFPHANGWAGAFRLVDTNYAYLSACTIQGTDGDRWAIGFDVCPAVVVNRGNVTFAAGLINRAVIGLRIAFGATGVVNNIQVLGTKFLYNGSGASVGGIGVQAFSMRSLNLFGVHLESYDIACQLNTVLSGQIRGCRAVNFGTPAGGPNQVGLQLLATCKEVEIAGNEFDSGAAGVGTGISLNATGHQDIAVGPNRHANIAVAVADAGTGGGRSQTPDPAGVQGFWFKDHVSANWLSVLQTNPVLALGNNNDVAIGSHGMLGITADGGGSAVTGIVAPTGPDTAILYLRNRAGGALTILHQSAASAAANRIITPTAATITIAGGALLAYDAGSQRWAVLAFS